MNMTIDSFNTFISIYGFKLLAAAAIFFIGKWAVGRGAHLLKHLMRRAEVDETLVSFAGNVTYALGLAVVIIAALSKLGIETTSLAAVIAAAGLAVGFALQGSLSNLASGVMIIIFRPFRVGDFIEAAGVCGVVEDVNIFTSTLKTGDNKTVIVPNNAITGGNITNYSKKDTRRVDLTFGIGYGDDIKKAKEVFAKVLASDERVLKDPEPLIAVSELASSSVNFAVRPWVKNEDYWAVYFDLTEKVKLALDKADISIPYPQQDVHLIVSDADKLKKAA